ncbi:hypothetical protein [Nocardia sp. NPDC004860]|uniref:hypothetical protein n=1 Tax=Nocardia sp. NPDC004860 TaxID=3154557 RepID=UPI0033AC8B72
MWYFDWPDLAERAIALGGDWPAAAELVGMATAPGPAIEAAVRRLAQQTEQDMNEPPPLGFWGTVCGLIARSWRLGLLDEYTAAVRYSILWYGMRDRDRIPGNRAQDLIYEGMACHYADRYAAMDITVRAQTMMIEADLFIPVAAVDADLCELVLDNLL